MADITVNNSSYVNNFLDTLSNVLDDYQEVRAVHETTPFYYQEPLIFAANGTIDSDGMYRWDNTSTVRGVSINTTYLPQNGETVHIIFKTGSDITTEQCLVHAEYHCNLTLSAGVFLCYDWTARVNKEFSLAAETNTEYEFTVKLNSDGTINTTLGKTEDSSTPQMITVTRSSSDWHSETFRLLMSGYHGRYQFRGTVDFKKCYIEDDNENVICKFFTIGDSIMPLEIKRFTENGTYLASSDNAAGYSKVEIDAHPEGVFIDKTIYANGTYNAEDDDADGYTSVTVEVPQSGGTAFPNVGYDIVGNPNIVDGIVTNSNLANHVESNMVLDFSKPFVFMTKFNFTSYEEQRPIVGDDYKLAVGLTNAGYLKLWLGTGSSWNIANAASGRTRLNLNTDYLLKFEWSGTEYNLETSSNELAFNHEINVSSSAAIANTKIYPGVFMVNDTLNLKGSVDLNKTYFISQDETKSWRAIADKSSNVTAVGNLTIDSNFTASGFASNTSYFTQPSGSYLEYGNNTSEVITAFTLNEYTNDSQAIVGVPVGSNQVNYLCVTSQHYLIQWNGDRNSGSSNSFQPQLNTKYIVRHITNGSTSTGYVIADDGFTLETLPPVTDSRYTRLYTNFTTYNWAGKLLDFGISKNHPAQYLHGSIDLNLTGFKINDEITYKAVK